MLTFLKFGINSSVSKWQQRCLYEFVQLILCKSGKLYLFLWYFTYCFSRHLLLVHFVTDPKWIFIPTNKMIWGIKLFIIFKIVSLKIEIIRADLVQWCILVMVFYCLSNDISNCLFMLSLTSFIGRWVNMLTWAKSLMAKSITRSNTFWMLK